MFFKQTGYKPRTNSQSSGKSGSAAVASSPPKDQTKTTSTSVAGDSTVVSAAVAGRRRSSAAGADKFAGLQGLKRGSQDTTKWAEQKPGQDGILGGMWNSFTKGS